VIISDNAAQKGFNRSKAMTIDGVTPSGVIIDGVIIDGVTPLVFVCDKLSN